ncbi:hypothetical protein MO973_44945 [Paenibacillus sp. TRM 82003]|nr:hypothetical protein [Paenibacillus sp. TRM 82003]
MNRKACAAVAGGALLGSLALTGPSQAATPRPDLAVTSVGWGTQSVVAGQPLTFQATITNKGTAATPEGTIHGVGFRVGGRTVTWHDASTTSLEPGESRTVRANWGPTGVAQWPAQTATVTAYVDDAKRITESNESNNTRDVKVTAQPSLSARLFGDATVAVYATPMNQDTGVSNLVTGDVYGACTDGPAVVVGTEQYLGTWSAGGSTYDDGGPFTGAGDTFVPASGAATRTLRTSSTSTRS